jgi:outer membrane protein assembly factor BamB
VNRTPLVIKSADRYGVAIWTIASLAILDARGGHKLFEVALPESEGDMVASLATDGRTIYCSDKRWTCAVDLPLQGKGGRVRWRTKTFGANCASPVTSQGLLFTVTDHGILSCLETNKGRVLWKRRLPGEYYSSPVVVGRCLYVTNSEGLTTVIRTSRGNQVIAQNELQDAVHATFAAVDGSLIARTETEVWCIRQSQTARSVVAR